MKLCMPESSAPKARRSDRKGKTRWPGSLERELQLCISICACNSPAVSGIYDRGVEDQSSQELARFVRRRHQA